MRDQRPALKEFYFPATQPCRPEYGLPWIPDQLCHTTPGIQRPSHRHRTRKTRVAREDTMAASPDSAAILPRISARDWTALGKTVSERRLTAAGPRSAGRFHLAQHRSTRSSPEADGTPYDISRSRRFGMFP